VGARHSRHAFVGLIAVLAGGALAPAAVAQAPADPPEAQAARESLVRHIAQGTRVRDPRVLDALRAVPRHLFVAVPIDDAYRDRPLPIPHGQKISQPTVVGMMTQALELTGAQHVLEIGTGSGYQAAVLSLLAARVDSIEIVPELGETARARLTELGYENVRVRVGDGYQGWPDQAPFDRILLTAAPPALPPALIEQLVPGGIIVGPVGPPARQRLVRWRKVPSGLAREDLGPIVFVPMVHDR
jgi:protein-L-isoaspartate(D-aspartate) O-methyltransferase